MSAPDVPQIGKRYILHESLGKGGMGEVFLARGASGQLRALKVVRADHAASLQAAARLRRDLGLVQLPRRAVSEHAVQRGASRSDVDFRPQPGRGGLLQHHGLRPGAAHRLQQLRPRCTLYEPCAAF